jgi:hypothetical protein
MFFEKPLGDVLDSTPLVKVNVFFSKHGGLSGIRVLVF